MTFVPVPEVTIDSIDHFEDLIASQQPFLNDFVTRDWPALSLWNEEHLKQRGAGCNVRLWRMSNWEPESPTFDYSIWSCEQEADYEEFVGQLFADTPPDPPVYLGLTDTTVVNIAEDAPMHPRLASRKIMRSAWMGSAGYVNAPHADNYDSVLAHVMGKKRVYLAPPGSRESLDRFPILNPAHNFFHTNIACETGANSKRLIYVADLEPGQTLVIPMGWVHQIHYLTTALSVNLFLRHHNLRQMSDLENVRSGLSNHLPEPWREPVKALSEFFGFGRGRTPGEDNTGPYG